MSSGFKTELFFNTGWLTILWWKCETTLSYYKCKLFPGGYSEDRGIKIALFITLIALTQPLIYLQPTSSEESLAGLNLDNPPIDTVDASAVLAFSLKKK